jgi:hypothetical protein
MSVGSKLTSVRSDCRVTVAEVWPAGSSAVPVSGT